MQQPNNNQQEPQYYNDFPAQAQPAYSTNNKKQKKSIGLRKVGGLKVLIGLVIIFQIIMIILLLNPSTLVQQIQNQQILSSVGSKTSLSSSETPVIASVTDADKLRSSNAAQAQVYKDAQNGDYVIGYTDRVIIYRKSEDKIIYDGVTPSGLVTQVQQKLIDDITSKAKDSALISSDSTETPQVSVIADIASLKESDPTFYASGRNNDIVALFPTAKVIILYNADTNTILNFGKYNTSITAL